MANVMILFPNLSDEATISGGDWATPLSNMQNANIQGSVARTDPLDGSPAPETYFDIDMGSVVLVRTIVLHAHNFSLGSTLNIYASENAGFTPLLYSAEDVPAWPTLFATSELEWEADNFWTGLPLDSDIQGFAWSFVHILPQEIYARYWRVEINDPLNADNYLQFSRLFMATQWQPTINYQYGSSIGFETDTRVEKSLGGSEFFDVREPYRVLRLNFDYLPEYEGFSRVLDLQRRAGLDKDIFVISDPDDAENLLRRSFLGRLRTLNTLEQAVFGLTGTSFEIKELK